VTVRTGAWILGAGLLTGALSGIQSLDEQVRDSVQARRQAGMDRVMQGISDAARQPTVLSLLLGAAVFGGPGGLQVARSAVLALIPTNLAVEGLKRTVNRTRPDGEHERSNASFPSSHAANAAALAWILAKRWPRASALFWIAAAAVAWSRIYLNRHFLSDVLVGVMIGVASSWVMSRLAEAQAARTAKLGGNRDESRRV